MTKNVEKMVLESINNSASVMPLFKTGYAYSQVLQWCKELENMGLIKWGNEDVRVLTEEGYKRLREYNECPQNTSYLIKPLNQYKREKKRVEDIYLP